MTKDILLANPILGPDYIDLSVGEPHLIREELFKIVHMENVMPNKYNIDKLSFTYPSPYGDPELVEFLEKKHGAKVIITNGAKQALGAAFYSIKKRGFSGVKMTTPHWALLPPLADLHGVDLSYFNYSRKDGLKKEDFTNTAYLAVCPNNPDGLTSNLKRDWDYCKKQDILMIHDGAYYSKIYYGPSFKEENIGNAQIYSISKKLGLSSLRVGYIVCHDDNIYKDVQYYMEHMTVGVSNVTQSIVLKILKTIDLDIFENNCYYELQKNRNDILKINSSIIEVVDKKQVGMFLWAKLKSKEAFEKAKLHIISGNHFISNPSGKDEWVRLNLALNRSTMKEVHQRLKDTGI